MARRRRGQQREQTVQPPVLDEVASLGRDQSIFGGFLDVLENPDKVLQLECGGDMSVYDDMRRDSRIGSNLRTRAMAVIGKEWEMLPYSDEAIDVRIAEYVKEVFLGFAFDKSRRSILSGGIHKGFSVTEVMWEVSEGDYSICAMHHRSQRRFRFAPDNSLRLMTADSPMDGINLSIEHPRKFQVFTFGDEPETPYGEGLGRELYWPWWFKKNGIKFWLQFCERFGAPTAVGRYPTNASQQQKDTLLNACDSIRQQGSITLPEGMSIDLLEAAKSGAVSTQRELVEFMNTEMSICILGQAATTQGTPGSLGNEGAQADVREDLVKADADALTECLNQGVVRWLVDLQFPGHSRYPLMWVRTGEEADLNKMAIRDKNLCGTGVRFRKNYYVGNYSLKEDEFDLVDPETGEPVEFAAKPDDDDVMASQVDRLGRSAEEPMQSMLNEIKTIVDNAEDLGDLQARLLDAWPGMDTEALADAMAEALTAAHLQGRYEILEGL